jgi:type IX secretion system PorP/SprF family membrane protein
MGFFLRFVLLGQLLTGCYYACAQNLPVYSSYYINPYLYNPAEAATEYTYIFLNHRQQWMGIEGSPQLTTLNAHSLLNNSHAAIGGKISSYKRGILTSTDILLSYAYGISISKNNTLYFGLSGGVISNTIDVTSGGVDPDDPAIQSYQANNIQPSANFGLLYRSTSGVNFGLVLPQLFAPKFNAASFGGTAVSPLDNAIVSLYYKKKVEGKIVSRTRKGMRSKVKTHEAYAPLEFYTLYRYAKAGNSQFEALVKLNVSENFWLAAGYRQAYGFTASTGIAFNKFLLGYSYELGNQPEAGFSSGTHELQLGLRLGKQKRFKRVAPLLRSTIKTNNEQHTARFQSTVEDPDEIKDDGGSKKKYYVVIRVFADFTGADAFKRKLIEQKYNANVFYNEKDRKYHVHVLETTKQSEASEEARNLKNYTKLKEAHVLTVTISGK